MTKSMYQSLKENLSRNKELYLVLVTTLITFLGYILYFPFNNDQILTYNLYFIRALINLSSAFIYIWVIYSIGGCFANYVKSIRLENVSFSILQFGLGISTLSFSFLLLGVTGNLSINNIFSIILFLLILGKYFSHKYPPTIFKSKIKETKIVKIVSIPFLIFAFLLASLPEHDWDSTVYHIPAIREFLLSHSIGIYPETEPFNFPMSHNLLYIPLDYLNLDSGIRFFNLFILIIGIKSLFQISKQFLKKIYANLATFIMLISFCLWTNAATARIEVPLCSYILIYYLVKLRANKTFSINLFLLSLIILGLISGTKSIGFIFAIFEITFIVVLFLLSKKIRDKFLSNTIPTYLLLSSLVLLIFPSAYWYGKNQLAFNSFNYPKSGLVTRDNPKDDFENTLNRALYFFGKNKETDSLLGSSDFSKRLKIVMDSTYSSQKYDFDYSLLGLVKNPEVFSRKSLHELNWFFLLIFFPLYLINKKQRCFFFAFFLCLIAVIFKGHLTRYAIPLVGVISFFVASNFQILEPTNKKFYIRFISCLICISTLIMIHQLIFTGTFIEKISLFSKLINHSSINSYLEKYAFSKYGGSSQLLQEINRTIPSNKTVLLIGEGKTLYLKPKTIGDYDQLSRQAIPWLRLIDDTNGNNARIYENLQKRKVNYIAINLKYYQGQYEKAKFFEKNNIRIKKLDRCHPIILIKTLAHLSKFLENYAVQVFYDSTSNVHIFKLLDKK